MTHTRFRYRQAQGLNLFYREAGDPSDPTIVLLHGFPSSSHMFRELIPRLADAFHVIAPDYPGFGRSSMPSPDAFDYSFANLADVVAEFLKAQGVDRFALYVMDYGGPIGMRVVEREPSRLTGLIVQNANFYQEGLLDMFTKTVGPLWTSRNPATEKPVRELLTLEGTKFQYTHGAHDPTGLNPDAWVHDQYGLDRPGNPAIQLDLQADYHTNIARYDQWRSTLTTIQPPTLIVWGKGDPLFGTQNVELLERDLDDVEAHVLDGGHFALEEHSRFIAERIHEFFGPRLGGGKHR
mgnify:CR=1 FL=1